MKQVKEFSAKLLLYLAISKPEYSKSIGDTKVFDATSESTLKDSVASVKETLNVGGLDD